MKNKKIVFSGTRATGRLHLGNYFGAVKGYIDLQNNPEYECIYMAVDLHTITTPYNPKVLRQSAREIIIDYLAAGLDPKKVSITIQSLVPEHTYLAFLFSSVMSVARMQHLPTYKEKVKQHPDNVTMALLNYPVLMAADILLYKAEAVPVGIDQEPHIEIAREVARKMNEQYGTDFPEPIRIATKVDKVPSLLGEGKMSKSVDGSFINLTDSLEEIRAKIAKMPTDAGIIGFGPDGKLIRIPDSNSRIQSIDLKKAREIFPQSINNLLSFVELFQGREKRIFYEKTYITNGIRYGELKSSLAEAIYEELKPIQEKRKELEANPDYVEQVIKEGTEKASKIAIQTLAEVKEKMGLG